MGLATARLLASKGAVLSLADLNEPALKAAAEALPKNHGEHIYTTIDVSNPKSVDEWIQSTKTTFGKLDGAVNMAGIIRTAKPITEMADADWESTFAVNSRGVFNCLRAQLRAMSDGGSIVSRVRNQAILAM